ncbi:MAG TPA: MaoC/PaaZ C-terminal domain-containing protein [Blastocatellia bacterium]|nr:MaoC/PaaZ C-terminal domain-containing protein [Blastocatellia bacterium]HMX28536.1 MaoC/PaaZ C-terminal domain-containing protein [Blastocatellia bacterium]HMY72520.1 MaoC/PaaZ C-terminal domain-containing protein [Blastocatellia bacterium]HMZ22397.1 MaoC/PaaZ C-terminal domain-containing protein [Blastocatellia bacterium]HNG34449.1 MaoC/PaaZ C-terminal domain-containing protein [Blastocatellia bacterium]
MARYFDDYQADEITTSKTRTITEADIVNFAGLSGDFHELHMSEEFAKRGPFGRRIAHGALIFSISTGLTIQMGDAENIIAFYGVDKLRFTHPTFIGDTIRVTKKVIALEPKGDERGVVAFETTVLNQTDQPVVVYQDRVLLKRRPK